MGLWFMFLIDLHYRNDPRTESLANSLDPDQAVPDQSLNCLPFHLHLLDLLLYGKTTLFKF